MVARKVVGDALKPWQAPGTTTANTTTNLHDVVKSQANRKFVRKVEEEMKNLTRQLSQTLERMSSFEAYILTKNVQLEQLQAEIVD